MNDREHAPTCAYLGASGFCFRPGTMTVPGSPFVYCEEHALKVARVTEDAAYLVDDDSTD